jgi:hypothetical protein
VASRSTDTTLDRTYAIFFFLNETRCPITTNFIDNLAYIEKRLLFGVYTFVKFI